MMSNSHDPRRLKLTSNDTKTKLLHDYNLHTGNKQNRS